MNQKDSKSTRILRDNYQAFFADPLDYSAFYAWRSEVEKELKLGAKELLRNAGCVELFKLLAEQFRELPRHWNAEVVNLKVRLNWLLEDLAQSTDLNAVRIMECIRQIERGLGKIQEEDQSLMRVPEVVLASRRNPLEAARRNRHADRTDLNPEEIRGLLRTCKTRSANADLSVGIVNSFYSQVSSRNPKAIIEFLEGVRETLIPIQLKIRENHMLMAFLDTLPYLMFHGHRAPYDENYIAASRLLADIVLQIVDHPLTDFRGEECEPLDEILHYYFHSLFYCLEQGRLAAFQDLFRVTAEVINQSEKFEIRYFYIPVISEMFYWIPAAYRDKLRGFMLDEVRKRISLKQDSPLRPLLELVNAGAGEDLDKFIVVSEFLKEVYKDGKITEFERQAVRNLLKALDVKPLEYRRVLREVLREYRHGEIQAMGDFDRNHLMSRLLRLALANKAIDNRERNLLNAAARAMGLNAVQFKEILKRTREEVDAEPAATHLETGFRRLGWSGVSRHLLKSMEWYKWNQMRLEGYQRSFESFFKEIDYLPGSSHFHFRGEIEDYFSPLEGEVKITSFEENQMSEGQEEIGVMVFAPRRMLRKWFEIANQIDYLLVDSTSSTFSVEFYLLNVMGSLLMTRSVPMQDPDAFQRLVRANSGRYRLFIVEEETKKLVYWQKVSSYLIEKRKIEPLIDALEARNFTSIKIISQIGQKKDPDEAIYYHAMIENVLFLSSNQEEVLKMMALCKELIRRKFQDDFKLYYFLGCLCFEVGRKSEAFEWLDQCLKIKPDYKEALLLYCERKLQTDILDRRALGYLKLVDLSFPKEERLEKLYRQLEKLHHVDLKPLIARSRMMTNTLALRQQG